MQTHRNRFSMIGLVLAVFMMVWILTGCSTFGNKANAKQILAQSELQARLDSVSADVRKLAIAQGGAPVIPDVLSITPEKGAAGASYKGKVARNPDLTPLLVGGKPVFEGSWAIGTSNSMRDVGNMSEAYLVLGGWAVNPKTGNLPDGAELDGLFLYMTGTNASSTMDSTFAAVWANASVAQKQAAADALLKYYQGKKDFVTSVITATGEQVTGIVKEVYSATPVGGAVAAVKALVDVAGKPVEGTFVAPYTVKPDGTPAPAVK